MIGNKVSAFVLRIISETVWDHLAWRRTDVKLWGALVDAADECDETEELDECET